MSIYNESNDYFEEQSSLEINVYPIGKSPGYYNVKYCIFQQVHVLSHTFPYIRVRFRTFAYVLVTFRTYCTVPYGNVRKHTRMYANIHERTENVRERAETDSYIRMCMALHLLDME